MTKVIWFTGISGAGKTTLAKYLCSYLEEREEKYHFLDGDQIRDFFEGDLGYSRKERIMNVRRVGFGAYLLAQNDIYAVVANIAPYYEVRDFLRKKIDKDYIQIYVKSSLDVVRQRDVKNHYKNFEDGNESNLIGVDDIYDEPRNPDLIIDTEVMNLEDSKVKLLDFIKDQIGN